MRDNITEDKLMKQLNIMSHAWLWYHLQGQLSLLSFRSR